jgi:Ala-tRNA(Pro) deacylase
MMGVSAHQIIGARSMPIARLKRFLEENEVKFDTVSHSQAFTAQEIAAAAHVPGKEMAKTVMVKLDGELAMAVLPAPDQVSTSRLKAVSGAERVELASENDFAARFPACEVGAMPPFGNLWDLPVFVDQRLREDEEIFFNAGSHTELLKLPYADYERLVSPVVAQLSTRT